MSTKFQRAAAQKAVNDAFDYVPPGRVAKNLVVAIGMYAMLAVAATYTPLWLSILLGANITLGIWGLMMSWATIDLASAEKRRRLDAIPSSVRDFLRTGGDAR